MIHRFRINNTECNPHAGAALPFLDCLEAMMDAHTIPNNAPSIAIPSSGELQELQQTKSMHTATTGCNPKNRHTSNKQILDGESRRGAQIQIESKWPCMHMKRVGQGANPKQVCQTCWAPNLLQHLKQQKISGQRQQCKICSRLGAMCTVMVTDPLLQHTCSMSSRTQPKWTTIVPVGATTSKMTGPWEFTNGGTEKRTRKQQHNTPTCCTTDD